MKKIKYKTTIVAIHWYDIDLYFVSAYHQSYEVPLTFEMYEIDQFGKESSTSLF